MGVNVVPSAIPSKTTDCTPCCMGRDFEFCSHFYIGDEHSNLSLLPSFLKTLTEDRRDVMEHSRCYFLYLHTVSWCGLGKRVQKDHKLMLQRK